MPHFTPDELLNREVAITLIGAGGNGSQMLTGLARLNFALIALGHAGLDVTVFDPDHVSEANMGRQLFSPADIGLNKAVVLVNRLNTFYGLRWDAVPAKYSRPSQSARDADMLIACVDSVSARVSIAESALLDPQPRYLMDLGNRAADGQVVFGECAIPDPDDKVRPGHVALPSPYALLPELIDTTQPEDNAPSCGLAEALEKQELFVNQAIVTPALQILWDFFRHGQLAWHGAFVNLRTGSMRPLLIKEVPQK